MITLVVCNKVVLSSERRGMVTSPNALQMRLGGEDVHLTLEKGSGRLILLLLLFIERFLG